MKVKISDIINAIEMTDQYCEYFLDKQTGEIVLVSDMAMTCEEMDETCEELDAHGFYRLPSSFDIRDYDIMEEFVYTLPSSACNELSRAISGRGAFRRFREGIRRLGLDQQWYDYQMSAYRQKAIDWCNDNELEYEP